MATNFIDPEFHENLYKANSVFLCVLTIGREAFKTCLCDRDIIYGLISLPQFCINKSVMCCVTLRLWEFTCVNISDEAVSTSEAKLDYGPFQIFFPLYHTYMHVVCVYVTVHIIDSVRSLYLSFVLLYSIDLFDSVKKKVEL